MRSKVAIISTRAGGDGQGAMNQAIRQLAQEAAKLGANGLFILASDTSEHRSGSTGILLPSIGLILSDDTTSRETVVKARALYVK